MTDRRGHKRVKKYFAVNIQACKINGKHMKFDKIKTNPKFYDESGLDFTPEGIKIMCSKPLPEDARIQMKLLIPDETSLHLIKAAGTIKWFKQFKGRYKKYFLMGVHFKNLRETEKRKLTRLWNKYKKP